MGSQRRREAIAAGKIVENAEAARRRRRQEASIIREEIAITLWARGKTAREISDELERQTGARLTSSVPELVRRGLYRRVQAGAEHVDTAREMFREYYLNMLQRWMPRALGDVTDPETGNRLPPDPRAADIVLRILRDFGVVEGVVAPPRSGDINLNVIQGVQLGDEQQRAKVLESLRTEAAKQKTIEGRLADTPAAVRPGDIEDGKVPPPVHLGPAKPPGE